MKTLTIYQMERLSLVGGMSDQCRRASITFGISFAFGVISGGLGILGAGIAGVNWMNSCGPSDF